MEARVDRSRVSARPTTTWFLVKHDEGGSIGKNKLRLFALDLVKYLLIQSPWSRTENRKSVLFAPNERRGWCDKTDNVAVVLRNAMVGGWMNDNNDYNNNSNSLGNNNKRAFAVALFVSLSRVYLLI